MNDAVDNLMLEHLKPFQAGQDRIERKMEEMTRRLSNLEAGHASIIQHLGHFASADAQQQLASDGWPPTGLTCAWNESSAALNWPEGPRWQQVTRPIWFPVPAKPVAASSRTPPRN